MGTTPVAQTQEKVLFAYTIRPGDTLWDIAKWVLKDPFQWPEMLKYNYIENPDLIYPGDRLIVPSPDVLEQVRQARDVREIAAIRKAAESGARVEELQPLPEGLSRSLSPTASELVRVPLYETKEEDDERSSDLKLSGRKNITLECREYKGGTSPNYFSSGYTRRESLNLTLSGQIMKTIKVEGEFYQSDQSLENTYMLKLSTDRMELLLGDFSATLPDTEFVLENRNISGGRFTADFASSGGIAIVGASKGIDRYEKFYGDRTQGPYYLANAPVVFGSEMIMLNKNKLIRGTEYEFDYFSGRIIFLKQVVDDVTLVEVIYESRQTIYPRSLYAARLWSKPFSWLRLAGSMVREEDPEEAGVVDVGVGNTLTPIGHWVLGTDVQSEIPGFGKVSGEFAFSRYQANRLVSDKTEGQALKAAATGSIGPVGMKGYYRRTSPEFMRVGGSEQGSDLLNYGGSTDFKTGGPYTLAGAYDYKEVLQNGICELTQQSSVQARVFPQAWPSLGYEYFFLDEQNDAQESSRKLDHETIRHTGIVGVEQDYYAASIRGEQEKREGKLADRNSAQTRRLEISANSKNLSWLTMSGLFNYQRVDASGDSLAALEDYAVTKVKVNGAFKPSERYSLTLANEWVWDEAYGSTRTLDTKLNLRPIDTIRLDADYTWETLQSLVGSVYQPVYTQTASGQLEITPWQPLSVRLSPSLRWTGLAQGGGLLNKTRTDLGTVKWAQMAQLTHELEGKRELYILTDSTDPGLRFQTEQETRKAAYAARIVFSNALSGDAKASYEQFQKQNYNSSFLEYDRLQGRERDFSLGLHSSVQAVWRMDGSYTLTLRDQDGTSAESVTRTAYAISETSQTTQSYDLLNSYGSLHTRQDTADGKVTYQWNEIVSSYLEGLYSRNEDQTGREPIIHTASVGAGLVLRWTRFRAEAVAKLAESWGGADTHQEDYTLTLNYNPVKLLALSLRGKHGLTRDPDTRATEVTMNCSVQF
ncbi:LysM peptidoglycan-binding domain-containing protein [bacterium]|nr:LysM peptidoglycan-binding domain-containing protein [bacterium]